MILQTERLQLREFTPDDLDALHALMSDPQVMAHSAAPETREETQARLDGWLASYQERGFGKWAVLDRATGAFIGYCGLAEEKIDDHTEIELGFRLFPAWWGRGLATEAAQVVVQHAFQTLHLERLTGFTHPENTASQRVLEKIGMRRKADAHWRGQVVRRYVKTWEAGHASWDRVAVYAGLPQFPRRAGAP